MDTLNASLASTFLLTHVLCYLGPSTVPSDLLNRSTLASSRHFSTTGDTDSDEPAYDLFASNGPE